MLMIYYDTLFDNKNLLFEFQYKQNLDYDEGIYVYIIDFKLLFMQLRNVINKSTRIIKKIRLNFIIKFNETKCFLIIFETTSLIIND